MSNILTAIKAIIENSSAAIVDTSGNHSQNRMNQMGDALEDYVKNAFADCIGQDKDAVMQARSAVFSYLGNSKNPPDAMLKGSDAIEIKKIQAVDVTQLQLNSSYPKNKLRADNPKICSACRDCETWKEKDMLYVVGQVDGEVLQNIFWVYGDLYCDSPEVYENIQNTIKDALKSLEDGDIAATNELGRVNDVDHLKITDLRVRGMWMIKNPFVHFQYLMSEIPDCSFKLVALIPEEKYNSFGNVKDFGQFCEEHGVQILDKNIENPKNPAELIKSKLIIYYK